MRRKSEILMVWERKWYLFTCIIKQQWISVTTLITTKAKKLNFYAEGEGRGTLILLHLTS